MTLAMAGPKAKAKAKQFYSKGINYDCHLRSSKYFYSTGQNSCLGLLGTHRKKWTNPICGFHREGAKASTATVAVTGTFTNDTLPV
jgi:hypothetical protein